MNVLHKHMRRAAAASLLAAVLLVGAADVGAVQTAGDRALHAERVVVRALTFMRTGYPDRAVDVYAEGLRVNPEEPVLLSGMADAQEAAGDLASARFYAARAVERAPDNPTYLTQLARISTAAGDMEAALSAYERLGEAAPDLLDVRLNHVDLMARLDRLDEAVQLADAILEDFPTTERVLSVQVDLLHETGQTDREIVMIRRLLDVRPTPEKEYELAVALQRSGQSEQALGVLTELLVSEPDMARARDLLLDIASREGLALDEARLPAAVTDHLGDNAPADSATVYRRRLMSDPEDSDSAAALARLLAADGQPLEAADVLVRQTERDPRRPDLWVSALRILVNSGEFDRAVALGEDASLLYPGYPPLALPYATALLGAGRDADALEIARSARAALDADDPIAVDLDTLIAEIEKPQ